MTPILATSQSSASPAIVSLLNHVATLITALGGFMALAMFAVSGLLFMSAGNSPARVQQAMRLAKNSIMGIVLMAMGLFLRMVITGMIKGTETATKTKKPSSHAPSHPIHIPWTLVGIIAAAALALALVATTTIKVTRKRALAKVTEAARKVWREMLEPGVEGPFVPTEGFEVLRAEKRGELDQKGSPVVRFIIAMYRFQGGAWKQLDDEVTLSDLKHTSLMAAKAAAAADDVAKPRFVLRMLGQLKFKSALPTEAELEHIQQGFQLVWPADTPVEELAEHWFDFQERVKEENRLRWGQMEDERIEDEVRKEELEEDLSVAELLPGPTTYDATTAAVKSELESEHANA